MAKQLAAARSTTAIGMSMVCRIAIT